MRCFKVKYIKKPIPIEAIQWMGDNSEEVLTFMEGNCPIFSSTGDITIQTLEGKMSAPIGSYIIKGVDGEFYPCRKEIFEHSSFSNNALIQPLSNGCFSANTIAPSSK